MLRDVDSHSCLRQLLLGQWLRNLTQYPNTSNCTYHFQWKGGRTSPPSSGFSIRNSTIDTATLVMTVIVLCVGYAALIAALVFNLIWRNNKHVKLASPRLNVLILVALSFTHIGPLLFALVLSANDYNIDIPLGGNILCGAHLTDTRLFMAILLLLIPDLVAFSLAFYFFPNMLIIKVLPENDDPNNYNFINITICDENDVLLPYKFGHALILFVLMAYFAIYTVQLRNRYSEEGRVTAVVTLLCFILLISYLSVVIFILNDLRLYLIGYLYTLLTVFSVLLTTVGLMFLPKVWSIYKDHKQVVRDKHSSEDHELQLTHFHGLLEKIQKLKLELKESEKKIASLKRYRETVKNQNTSSECVEVNKGTSHECMMSTGREMEASLQAAVAHREERGTESREEELERTSTEETTGIELLPPTV